MMNNTAITRRELLRVSAAATLTTGVGRAFVTPAHSSTAPKRGGGIRIGLAHGSTTDSLSPASPSNAFTQLMAYTLRNNLTEIDARYNLQPELAESWEASSDQKQWVFKLRRDVVFHNGKSLTADDVIATFNFHLDAQNASAGRAYLSPVIEVSKDDSHTVVFQLSAGNVDWPYILADFYFGILPARDDGSIEWDDGIGSGPYVLERFEPGVRALYRRNGNYWRSDRPYFDEATVLTIADLSARNTAFVTREIDVMDRVDFKTIPHLKQSGEVQVVETPSNGHYVFPMHVNTPPFDDNNVRLALRYAIDREAFHRTILGGYGRIGNDHCVSSIQRFHASEIPQRQYDPDRAMYHLRQANLGQLEVSLHASEAAFTGAVDAAALYREQAAEAGININIVREPIDGYWTNIWRNKPFMASYTSSRPIEDMYMTVAYTCGADWSSTYFCNERFDNILAAARAESDLSKRRDMYVELQQILYDEGGDVIPAFFSYIVAADERVRFNEIAGNWDLDGYKALERWWFD